MQNILHSTYFVFPKLYDTTVLFSNGQTPIGNRIMLTMAEKKRGGNKFFISCSYGIFSLILVPSYFENSIYSAFMFTSFGMPAKWFLSNLLLFSCCCSSASLLETKRFVEEEDE